jgi:hypothetical protein
MKTLLLFFQIIIFYFLFFPLRVLAKIFIAVLWEMI